MSKLIMCHECPHSIEHHDSFGCQMCNIDPVTRWAPRCRESSSSIACVYGEERARDAMDSHRCDEQAERAYRSAITAEADARRLHSARDEVAVEATLARQAHRSCRVDHFAHDYCRWVGMSEAYHNVLNILDRKDDE